MEQNQNNEIKSENLTKEVFDLHLEKTGIKIELEIIHLGMTDLDDQIAINTDLLKLLLDREDGLSNAKVLNGKKVRLILDYRRISERLIEDSESKQLLKSSSVDIVSRKLGIGLTNKEMNTCYLPLNGIRDAEKVVRHEITHLLHQPGYLDLAASVISYSAIPSSIIISQYLMYNSDINPYFNLLMMTVFLLLSNQIIKLAPVEKDSIRAEKLHLDRSISK